MGSLVNNKYKILEKIGEGSFGSIYKGQNIRTGDLIAIKAELVLSLKLLKNESIIYQYLNGVEGIPQIKWFGKDEYYYYMVISLHGKSLKEFVVSKGRFSLQLTLKVGVKVLKIIKDIHDKGLVHRDIKPDNFLFGINDLNHLYLIDFGFCKSYIGCEPRKTSALIGSNNYASIHSHKCMELSRRDDLESWCYMLLYFLRGSLPWNITQNQNEIITMKECVITDNSYPSIILDTLKYVRTLNFGETPNYFLLIHKFEDYLKTTL